MASGGGMSLASLRRFWAVAARRNSSRAPQGPRMIRLAPAILRCTQAAGAFMAVAAPALAEPSGELAPARPATVDRLSDAEHAAGDILSQPVRDVAEAEAEAPRLGGAHD